MGRGERYVDSRRLETMIHECKNLNVIGPSNLSGWFFFFFFCKKNELLNT